MTTVSQRSFSSGEISPSLYARTELSKHATGLRICSNMFILRYGGSANRSGTSLVGPVKDNTKKVRLIPFIFNNDQTYMLEFGNLYIRVIRPDGKYATVTNTEWTITDIDQSDAAATVVDINSGGAANNLANDDVVQIFDTPAYGMGELNKRLFKITVASGTAESVTLWTPRYLNALGNDSNYYLYSNDYQTNSANIGAKLAKVYEITTPYLEADLMNLDFSQSADVISIAHPSYAPRELSRVAENSWTLSESGFAPVTPFPTAVLATAGGAGSNSYRYKVTAINKEGGEESLPGTVTASINITGVTQANPAVVTAVAHGYSNNDEVYISGIAGMTELNNRIFYIDGVTANTFQLVDINSSAYTAYSSGGTVKAVAYRLGSAAAPNASAPHVITWTRSANAVEYNIYKETNGVFGQIGIATGATFSDINITPNVSFTPPTSRNPFVGTGNYPSVVTYGQQKKIYANTDNDPEKIFLSRSGNFTNFTTSKPIQDDDAVTFELAGRQVNEVRSLIDLGKLVILTSGGEWGALGNDAGIITPSAINAKQYSYNGSGTLRPIVIDGAALYQQSRGSIIRDLAFDFNVDGYAGNDLTIFSAHLFDKYTLVDWAFQQIPHSILWVVRSDGVLLGCTYVKNQQVLAWHRHDVGGFVESVAVIPNGNEDVLYLSVKRTIDGVTERYIERLNSRQVEDIKDCVFMDAAFTLDGRNTNTAITITLSGGTLWDSTETFNLAFNAAGTDVMDATWVNREIHVTDSDGGIYRLTVEAFTNYTTITVRPNREVPASLRSVATSSWAVARKVIGGLWHLEGEEVSILGDGFVAASPNNESYTVYTVANGKVTLDRFYSVLHVGLPYLSDMQTLDIDVTETGKTIMERKKNISRLDLFVEDTRGIWAGANPPSDDDDDPLENLSELKIRSTEGYDVPVDLATEVVSITLKPEWNSHGRIFIRQADPLPMTILAVSPAGKIPFGG